MSFSNNNDIFGRRAKDRLIGEHLDSHEFPKELIGKPLKLHPKNFTTSTEHEIQAYVGGPPKFAIRARKIETTIEKLYQDLDHDYAELIDHYGDNPTLFAKHWNQVINSLELKKLNSLIEKHNKYYPVEAGLRLDSDTGKYMLGSTPWKEKKKITKAELLEQFPSKLS
ncbi:MAG: hypothetical protein MI922_30645 [Bacteroidales bacterium]|nr:hypothetical protein [Bacteroidales bacterium]